MPALFWRAFFISTLAGAAAVEVVAAPPGSVAPPPLAQVGVLDQAEGRRLIAGFREAGIAGNYFLQFELRALPRRGEERVFVGKLWGGRNEQGTISRIELTDADGKTRRFLVQNGERAGVWGFGPATATVTALGGAAQLAPLLPGVNLSAFDLQLPYLYWPDVKLEAVARARGRPAHVFLFRPPAGFAAQHPEISGVRAYLDTQFNAMAQSELLGADGRVLKTLSLVDLKRVGEQMMLKSVEVRDEATRDKTRFQVTGAALGLDFSASLFEPATLADEVKAPAAGRIVPFK